MFVKDCMTHHPVMIDQDLLLTEARSIMVANEIGHLPVVNEAKHLLGLITRSHFSMNLDQVDSLDMWEINNKLFDLKVKNVMVKKRQVITISPEATVEQAARLLTQNKIGCLPVVENEQIVGIITTIDLLRSYQQMLGMPSPGIRVTVRLPASHEGYSQLAKLLSAIGDKGWGVIGLGTFPSPNKPEWYDVVVKIPGVTQESVQFLVDSTLHQKIVDIREAGVR